VYGNVSKEIKILEDNLVVYEKERKIVQNAISYIKILKGSSEYSLLELRPITGRKHQLRKQLYNIGNSIIGDDKYYVKRGKDFIKSKNLMLHAYEIKFMINNVKYNFRADFNKEFKDFISKKDLNIF